jgi:hypothetical protein
MLHCYFSLSCGICINLQVVGGGDYAARNTSLALAYLSSYEHMGMLEVACMQGCTCTSAKIDAHHTRPESQTTLKVFEVTRAGTLEPHGRVA